VSNAASDSLRSALWQPLRHAVNVFATGASTRPRGCFIAAFMTIPPQRSTLYRLIEAGQLARHAVLAPLRAHGLEPGDDAILFGLADPAGAPRDDLLAYTGLPEDTLDGRLRCLEERGLLLRLAVGPELLPGARLSRQGHLLRETIAAHWDGLEESLRDALGGKGRRHLRQALQDVIALLDGEKPRA